MRTFKTFVRSAAHLFHLGDGKGLCKHCRDSGICFPFRQPHTLSPLCVSGLHRRILFPAAFLALVIRFIEAVTCRGHSDDDRPPAAVDLFQFFQLQFLCVRILIHFSFLSFCPVGILIFVFYPQACHRPCTCVYAAAAGGGSNLFSSFSGIVS